MEGKLYSIAELAPILKLHPKTILRFVREGRLRARKLGRSWTVSEEDLRAFAHGELASPPAQAARRDARPFAQRVSVSAVIEIEERDSEEANRIANSLLAMLNGKDESWGPVRFDFFYYPEVGKAKYLVYGAPGFIAALVGSFDRLCRPEEA
jgi:excisionase family DNA binding protein